MAKTTPEFDFEDALLDLYPRAGIKHPESVYMEECDVLDDKVVVMKVSYNNHVAHGMAICGPNDKFNPNIGKRIACARALRNVQKKVKAYYV